MWGGEGGMHDPPAAESPLDDDEVWAEEEGEEEKDRGGGGEGDFATSAGLSTRRPSNTPPPPLLLLLPLLPPLPPLLDTFPSTPTPPILLEPHTRSKSSWASVSPARSAAPAMFSAIREMRRALASDFSQGGRTGMREGGKEGCDQLIKGRSKIEFQKIKI